MNFLLSHFNHDFPDHLAYLRNGLTVAGYEASLKPTLERPDTVNVLLENFDVDVASMLKGAQKKLGLRLVLMASEIVTGDTFNDFGPKLARSIYSLTDYWKKRREGFMQVAETAEAIWCLSDYQIDGYRRLLPDKPIATVPLCFDPHDADLGPTPPQKDCDVFFYGSMTDYRREILNAIGDRYRLRATYQTMSRAEIDESIHRARLCLHLRISPEWPYTSNFRHHTLLMRQAYILSEATPLSGELDPYVDICPREAIVDRIGELLRQPASLADRAREMHLRYAAERPVSVALTALIARSLRGNSA